MPPIELGYGQRHGQTVLQKTVDDLRYRDLKYLAIDEIYVAGRRNFTPW